MGALDGKGRVSCFRFSANVAMCHVYKHIYGYIHGMSLKGSIQLGIFDLVRNHGQPITLTELVSKLHIDPQKTRGIHRIIRFLVHTGSSSPKQKFLKSKKKKKPIRSHLPPGSCLKTRSPACYHLL